MGKHFSKSKQQNDEPKTNNQEALDYWSKKQKEALATIEATDLNESQKLHQNNHLKNQEQQFQQVEQSEISKVKQPEQPQTLPQEQQQKQQEQQRQKEEINQEQKREEIFDKDVEDIWLTRVFAIDKAQKKIMKKQTDLIPSINISVDLMVNEMIYSILKSNEFKEDDKFNWLLEGFINLSQAKIYEEKAQVKEGFIQIKKHEKIMDSILSYLIKGVLYPNKMKWAAQRESIISLDDKTNNKATLIYQSIFGKAFSIFSFQSSEINYLLNFLENKTNLNDARLFLDFMFKRELIKNRSELKKDFDQPIITLKFLIEVANYPKLTQSLLMNSWAYGNFQEILTGRQFTDNSLVGQLLSISGLPIEGRNLIDLLTRIQQNPVAQGSNQSQRSFLIMDEFIQLFKLILRKGPKQELFRYISKIIELNLDLENHYNKQKYMQCSPPGMIVNLQQILLSIFNPWINTVDKIRGKLEKVDRRLLTLKQPILNVIYRNIQQLAPNTYIEQEEEINELDPMTMIFLLTQRVNHIVVTYLDQVYIEEFLPLIKSALQKYGPNSYQHQVLLRFKGDFDTTILERLNIQNNMQFLSFQCQLAMSLIDQENKQIYPYGLLAESFIKDIHTYIQIYDENLEQMNLDDEILSCCQYIILIMNHKHLLPNLYLRIKGVELLNCQQEKSGIRRVLLSEKFKESQIIKNNLILGLLKAFVDSEKIGRGIILFLVEKLKFRQQFCKLFKFFLEKHPQICREQFYSIGEKEIILAFVNSFLNDIIHQFDECLISCQILKEIEDQIDSGLRIRQIELILNEKILQIQSEFMLEFHATLQILSQVYPEAFVLEEVIEKQVNFMNFTLYSFNGPSATQYQSRAMKQANFDPRRLMVQIIGLFINLSKIDQFLEQVVKDERSFSIDLLKKTLNSLDNQILPQRKAFQFQEIIVKLTILKEQEQELNSILTDIPNEFIDPLINTLMIDPVKLPHSNMIVDRVTIKKQLLNSSQDPFDRSHLTLDMLIELPELKQRIKEYLENKKSQIQNKQTIKQQHE